MAQFNLFLVDPVIQQRSAKEIAENLIKVRKSNEMIFTRLFPQLDQYWIGEAKNTVVTRYIELQEILFQLIRSYEELQNDLEKVAENYVSADQEVMAHVRSFNA